MQEIDRDNPICPHCQANLREVGIKTSEVTWANYTYEWYEPNGEWVSERQPDDDTVDTTDDNHAYCGKCKKELSWREIESIIN